MILVAEGIRPGAKQLTKEITDFVGGEAVKPFLLLLVLAVVGCASTQSPRVADSSARGRWAGKTVVITGASSGIGRGAAVEFGRQGANVVLAARRTNLLEEVAGEVRARGGTPLVITTDVSKAGDIERLAQAAVRRFGRIDVWVNNAGRGVVGPLWDAPVADYSRLIDINLKGVVYGSHAAVRQFRAQGGGTLVNVGSVVSEVPMAYYACYSATKAGVLSLDRALNEELRLNRLTGNIKVATIMPWAVDTPWWKHAANYSGHTPRMLALDDPSKVVNAIVNTAEHPSKEVPVGWKAQGAYISHRIAPDITETISGNIVQREQMEKGASAPVTTGSLYRPIQAGRFVEGGQREEMKREDQQRRRPAPPEGPGSQ